ncbi:MAG: alpha/beta fold hydrolase [Thermoguttaceae bacterium]|nr:alpha/beta fold hydrolase [Thermoguttaceae bacterium]
MEKITEKARAAAQENVATAKTKRRGKRGAIALSLAAATAFAVFVVGVRAISPIFIFHPNDDQNARAELARIAEETGRVAALRTALDDGTEIFGWAALAEAEGAEATESLNFPNSPNSLGGAETERPVVLYFEGNGGNSAARTLDVVRKPGPLAGFDFVCCDYPGYGESGGEPCEKTLKSMGLAAYDATVEAFPGRRIVVFGFSLGTGVATYVASERKVDGLILAAPYADGFDLFNNVAPIFYGPTRLAVPYRMESVKFAEKVDVRPLILATRVDELVPCASAERLAKAFESGAEFVAQDDVEHHWVWSTEIASAEIAEYLRSLTPSESAAASNGETR